MIGWFWPPKPDGELWEPPNWPPAPGGPYCADGGALKSEPSDPCPFAGGKYELTGGSGRAHTAVIRTTANPNYKNPSQLIFFNPLNFLKYKP